MKKKIISALLCAAMIATMATGCGSGSSSDSSSDSTAKESKTDSSTFVIAKNEDSETLDPAYQVCSGGIQAQSAIGEGLVRATEDGQDVEACLATDWTVSDDGLTYTFNLIPDLKFSDGNDVTLDDWKFTFDRCANATDGMWSYVAEDIADVTEPEEDVLQITLKAPSACFLAKLAMFPMYVQEKAHYDEVGDDGYATDGAIMCGPFAVEEYKQGEYLLLKKNENYRNADDISVDNLKLQIVTDDDSRVTMLKSGEIDVAENIPTASYDEIKDGDNTTAVEINSTLTKYLILNNTTDELSDVRVRKAISLAINKDNIVKMVLNGYGEPASSYMSRYGQFYNEDVEKNDDGYDIDKAKELMKEAGYEDGFDLEVLIPSGDSSQSNIVTVLKDSLAQININVTESALDDSAYKETKYDMKHQACIATWMDDMIDPDGLNGYWWDYSINSAYYSGFQSEETTNLYQQTKTETDKDKRAEEFAELQQLYYDNVVSVPLYNAPFFEGVSSSVEGFSLTPLGAYYNIAAISK